MPVDPRIAAVLAHLPAPPDPAEVSVEDRRAIAAAAAKDAGVFRPVSEPVDTTDLLVPGAGASVPVRVYRPGPGRRPVMVWVHGGGWWQGSVEQDDLLCRRRAVRFGCVVVSVDYRLAPEHPFPAGLSDCRAVLDWLRDAATELEVDVDRLVLAGGSAGANLALSCALAARDAGGPAVAALLLEVPGVDLTLRTSAETLERYGEGLMLTRVGIQECVRYYLGGADPEDWRVSPLLASSLAGLPPTLVTVAEADPIRADGEALAAQLDKEQVEVLLEMWEGQIHGSMLMDGLLPDVAERYDASVRSFLSAHDLVA